MTQFEEGIFSILPRLIPRLQRENEQGNLDVLLELGCNGPVLQEQVLTGAVQMLHLAQCSQYGESLGTYP